MKKIFAILGIVIGAFIVVGGTLIGVGFAMGAKNNINLFNGIVSLDFGRPELVRMDYKNIEEFDSLYIDMDYGSVEIVKGDEYAVEYELYSDNIVCEVVGGKFTFKERRRNNFVMGFDFGWFGFRNKGSSYLKVYVPENRLQNVEIYTDMGSVDISGMSCEKLTVECDMGAIECKNVNTGRLYIDADMGGVNFTGTVTDKIDADVDMGSVSLAGWLDCDFDIDADMGSVDIVTYYSAASYRYNFDVGMGGKEIRDNGGTDSETVHYMDIDCDMGGISVTHKSDK